MNLKKRQRNAELNYSVMRSVYFPRKRALDKKADAIEKREAGFAAKEEQLRQRETKVDELE